MSGKSIKQSDLPCGGDGIHLITKIGAVDHSAVAGQRQGEEGLAQCIDIQHGVLELFGIDSKHPLVAIHSTGLESNIDSQTDEKGVEQGDHQLVGFFNAGGDAQHHDDKGDNKREDQPEVVAKSGSGGTEGGTKLIGGGGGENRAGESSEGILKDPANNDGVADGKRQRTHHGDAADQSAQLAVAAGGTGLTEGTHGTAAGGTAEGHLAYHAGETD